MKLSAIIRIAAPVVLVAAGMAVPVSAQSDMPTDYDRAIVEEGRIQTVVERILADVSLDPCRRLRMIEFEIEDTLSRVPPAYVDSVRAKIAERFDEPLEIFRKTCGKVITPPPASERARAAEAAIVEQVEYLLAENVSACLSLREIDRVIEDELSRVSPAFVDSVRARIAERFDLELEIFRRNCGRADTQTVLPGGLGEIGVASDSTTFCTFRPGNPEVIRVFSVPPPPPPECPDGSEDCASEPESDGIELPPTVLPPDDVPPGETPEPFIVVPLSEDPCERLEVLTARFLELSGNLFITGNKRGDIERVLSEEAVSILPQLLLLRQRCPGPCEELRKLYEAREGFDEFLELVAQARKADVPLEEKRVAIIRARAFALQEDIDRLEKLCPDLNPFFEQIELLLFDDEVESEESCIEGICPPKPDCEPGEPCGDLFTEEDPVPPDQEDPLPVNVPFSVPVKATSTALDSGERAEQIAGQVVVLLTPDQLNPELPQPGAERPQLGHDADRASGVTDENGRIDITVDLTEFVRETAGGKLPDGGPSGAFEITVDTTARDGFIVTLPAGEPLGKQVSRFGLDRLLVSEIVVGRGIEADGGETDPAQFGVFNGPTDQIDLARRIIVNAIPEAVIESDLCMIKEPAAVIEYNGCDFEGERPSPGMRVLVPPPPHADLPGGSIDLAIAKDRSAL